MPHYVLFVYPLIIVLCGQISTWNTDNLVNVLLSGITPLRDKQEEEQLIFCPNMANRLNRYFSLYISFYGHSRSRLPFSWLTQSGTQLSPFYLFSQGQNMMGGRPDTRQR